MQTILFAATWLDACASASEALPPNVSALDRTRESHRRWCGPSASVSVYRYLDESPARVAAETTEQARDALGKHFFADRLHLIVAGDLDKFPE